MYNSYADLKLIYCTCTLKCRSWLLGDKKCSVINVKIVQFTFWFEIVKSLYMFTEMQVLIIWEQYDHSSSSIYRSDWWDIWGWCCMSTWERSTPRCWEVSSGPSRGSSMSSEWPKWPHPSKISSLDSPPSSKTGQSKSHYYIVVKCNYYTAVLSIFKKHFIETVFVYSGKFRWLHVNSVLSLG